MSVERSDLKTLRNVAISSFTAGMALGSLDGFRTVLLDHRTNTHHSTKLHPRFRKVLEFTGRSIMQEDSRLWPDAHLDHHAFADVALFPYVRISRAINWVEKQKAAGKTVGVEIPSEFSHLDPKVDGGEYPRDEVRLIGDLAEEHAREKLGALYVSPKEYTKEELQNIFHQKGPDYFYKPYKKKRRQQEYSHDEMAALVLQDPHSPLYADPTERNGVKKILQKGLLPYLVSINVRKVFPEILSEYTKPPEGEEHKSVWPAVAAGVLSPGIAVLLGRGKYQPKDFAIAAAASAIATATRIGFVAAGSMSVNSWGHSGENVTPRRMWQAATSKEYTIGLKSDGTVASNLRLAGPLTWLIHLATEDEVFGQEKHHKDPSARKYTDEEGLRGLLEAPVGFLIDTIAKNKRIHLIEPGDNFSLQPGERRPDEPHPATLLVQKARARQYLRDQGKKVFPKAA